MEFHDMTFTIFLHHSGGGKLLKKFAEYFNQKTAENQKEKLILSLSLSLSLLHQMLKWILSFIFSLNVFSINPERLIFFHLQQIDLTSSKIIILTSSSRDFHAIRICTKQKGEALIYMD